MTQLQTFTFEEMKAAVDAAHALGKNDIENADTRLHFPAGSKERLRDYIRRNVDTAQKAFRAGVRIIMGSDAVYNGWSLNTKRTASTQNNAETISSYSK